MAELVPVNPFPNAPGLAEELELMTTVDGTLPPAKDEQGRVWYSICSKHRVHQPDCDLCRVGNYHEYRSKP